MMSAINEAQNLYNNMSDGPKTYLAVMMGLSAQNPEEMQKVLQHPNTPTYQMTIDDVVLYNSVNNLHSMCSPQDRAKVNQFISDDNTVKAMHHGLNKQFNAVVFGNVKVKGLHTSPQQNVISNHENLNQPQLQQKRLHQGVNLLNNLSPAGRHYFMVNVNAANDDLKHYNHLEYSDPSTLTQTELQQRQRLNGLNDSGQSSLQANKIPSTSRISPAEQDAVHDFMKDDVTQEELQNHEMYDSVYQMNKRNRILAENRSDDAKNVDPFGRTNSVQLGNRAQSRMIYDKSHRVGFKVGTLAAVTAYHIPKISLRKMRRGALLNDNSRTKRINAIFSQKQAPKQQTRQSHIVHPDGPTL